MVVCELCAPQIQQKPVAAPSPPPPFPHPEHPTRVCAHHILENIFRPKHSALMSSMAHIVTRTASVPMADGSDSANVRQKDIPTGLIQMLSVVIKSESGCIY